MQRLWQVSVMLLCHRQRITRLKNLGTTFIREKRAISDEFTATLNFGNRSLS